MQDLKGKKLLVLGGSEDNVKYVIAAKELGVYVICTDIQKNTPAKAIADEFLDISVFDVENLVDYCKNNGVNGVINFSNTFSQLSHQRIAEALGFPAYGTREQVLGFTEKQLFKRICLENGLDVIPEYSEEEILSSPADFSVIVKPDDNSGSRGICVCNTREELKQGIDYAKSASTNGKILIEKNMTGHDDLNVLYFVCNGEVYLIDVEDRYLGTAANSMERNAICSVSPSKHLKMYLDHVNDRVIKMIKNSGVKNSPIFMQGFVDGETVRFYDPGIRFPGGTYISIRKQYMNIDLMRPIIEYALTGHMKIDEDRIKNSYLPPKKKILLGIYVSPGKIGKIEGVEKVKSIPEVYSFSQLLKVGSEVSQTGDIRQRAFAVGIYCENDVDTMHSLVRKVQSELVILDEAGNNMIIDPIFVDKIK